MIGPAGDRDQQVDVAEVLVRYATGIDRRDWALFRSCFTEDCEADYGDIGVWHGADSITRSMEELHAACGPTLHRITNPAITPNDHGVAVRSYVDAIVMDGENRSGTQAVGYYDDELVATDGGWKIARRRFTMVRVTRIDG
ncbi:MAG: polyketide cyclase [Actinomycetia bacterium]|nr:polyketide cyclase [Actinomycetes bacterium]